MGVIFLIWLALLVFVFGIKLFVVLGLVVAAATFLFPFGLMGFVALGVVLLFLLAPKHRTD
jgi:hypothetical protein